MATREETKSPRALVIVVRAAKPARPETNALEVSKSPLMPCGCRQLALERAL